MKRSLLTAAAATLVAGSASAGGIDRTNQPTA
jgi:hypothetical protein